MYSKVKFFRIGLVIFLMLTVAAVGFSKGKQESPSPMPEAEMAGPTPDEGTETAVVAGGCFWGVEAVFERLDGVLDVMSGYSGGASDTAKYSLVGSGATGHAESVQIVYDPERVDFETLLEVFFNVAHDPTQLDFQGPDIGSQYRSAVFYANDEQKQMTENVIKKLDAEKTYPKPIVTQVVPLERFYPAEGYHQDFMRLNPQNPYILYWDRPKISHLEKAYPDLLTDE